MKNLTCPSPFEKGISMSFSTTIQLFLVGCAIALPTLLHGQGAWYGDQQTLWVQGESGSTPIVNLSTDLRAIARTASGGGWIAIEENNQLIHVDSSGAIIEVIDTVVGVQSLAIAASGHLWGTRPGLDDVIRIESGAGIVSTHPVGSVPYGISIDAEGHIWVSCSYANQVDRLDGSGEWLATYPVGFFPTGISAAAAGGVWVAEKGGLKRLSSTGEVLWSATVGTFPIAVTTDLQGRAWFCCQTSNEVVVVGDQGVESVIDVPHRPLGIGANGDGSVTVVCHDGSSLVRISAEFEIVSVDLVTNPNGHGDLTGLQRALLADPLGDQDNDGMSNLEEAQFGFNPLDASSIPSVFIRGDTNRDGVVDLTDAIHELLVLFGVETSPCLEALDVDDDSRLTLGDPIRILDFVFSAGPAPAAPFPEYGPDPSPAQGFPCAP